ncbi:MAG TPA: sugar ABC transporter permease, partial [Ilumatobacteraceae bacterium]|nr:sugar ABC transporter permease [Ilumatobacteraceae bacterium]
TYFSFGAIALHLVFIVIPSVMGIYYALTNWSRFSSATDFVGLDNFRTVFRSHGAIFQAVKNTLIFTGATIVTKTVLGLLLALLVSRGIRRFSTVHRAVIYLPAVLPMIVVGIVFKSILNPSTGLLNRSLDVVGLGSLTQHWLTDTDLALFTIVAVDTWKGVGFIMLLLLAGLESIPREFHDAARIDGASAFKEFRYITLPLLKPVLTVTTVLNLLYGLKVFDSVWVLTNGGPGYATETVNTIVFKEFARGHYAVSAALSTVLFVVMTTAGLFLIRAMHKQIDYA